MIQRTNSKGEVYSFAFDLDRLAEYEATHPDYSIMDDFRGDILGRVTTLNRLASYLGLTGFKEFGEAGFDITDLSEILTETLSETGFIPRSTDSSEETGSA